MTQIKKKFIENNAIDEVKIRLSNDAFLRARNAANSADVSILKVDASDVIQFSSVPEVAADPTSANALVRKSYVDNLLNGLKWKNSVRAATTADITLSGAQTIDGVSVIALDRVLVKNQADASENGIYVAAAGAWSRALDADAGVELVSAAVFAEEGTVNADKGFVCTTDAPITINTTDINFAQFTSAGSFSAGNGISIVGSTISVDHDGEGLTFSGTSLALELDGATLAKSASGLKVATSGITATELASNAVTTVKILDANVTLAKLASLSVDENKLTTSVAGAGLAGGAGTALSVNVDATTIEINADTLRVKDLGISTAKIADDAVTAAKLNADTAGDGIRQEAGGALSVDSTREALTLDGTDITNQYKDMASKVVPESIELFVDGGPIQRYGVDYDVDNSGAVSRVRFDSTNLPSSDLATGAGAALVATDILRVRAIKL